MHATSLATFLWFAESNPPMKRTLSDVALVCAFAIVFGPTSANPQVAATPTAHLDSADVAAWREDLRFMAREMEKRHRNLYHTVSRASFGRAVASLHQRIPSLARHEIIVELARIAALVQDGHTNVAPTRDPQIGFTALPVKLYFFKDGLFVRAAHRTQAMLAGARVVRIGGMTPDQAYARVRELVGRDNEMDARFFAPFLLTMPEILHALRITSSPDEATFVLELGSKRQTVTLRPLGPASMMPPDTDISWWPDSAWTDMRPLGSTPPLWLRENPSTKYWLEYLPADRLVYAQYNQVANKEDESIAQFADRLRALVDSVPNTRLALDLRLNRGGNGSLNRPLLLSLIKSRNLEGRGKLFVIIGRSTFSAAQFLVNELEQYTDAVFVGEPSGGKANSYGDSRKITLPNSKITVRVSTLWWQEDPRDIRPWKGPDVAAELTSQEYARNLDPALEVVRTYRAEPSVAERMEKALNGGPVEEAVRRYRAYKADPRHAYVETEDQLNGLGYALLEKDRVQDAVRIFDLNAAEHPRSANVYDSLGDAYLKLGSKAAAIRSYRKSLELDPSNANARNRLQELGQ
jgi:tetratricopeptide (TPR) repeat protein